MIEVWQVATITLVRHTGRGTRKSRPAGRSLETYKRHYEKQSHVGTKEHRYSDKNSQATAFVASRQFKQWAKTIMCHFSPIVLFSPCSFCPSLPYQPPLGSPKPEYIIDSPMRSPHVRFPGVSWRAESTLSRMVPLGTWNRPHAESWRVDQSGEAMHRAKTPRLQPGHSTLSSSSPNGWFPRNPCWPLAAESLLHAGLHLRSAIPRMMLGTCGGAWGFVD